MENQNEDPQAEYNERLQRRMAILKKQFDAGKIRIRQGLQVIESLKNVRYAADGTVDLSTVDGLVRSMALAVEAMHDREEMKNSASLSEIQSAYFKFIEKNFGTFYKVMVEKNLTPHDAGMSLSRTPSTVEELNRNLDGFLDAIEDFWRNSADVAHAHVEDMHDCMKAVFGGDLFPSSSENIASKCGIYADTIILPDPYLRSKHIFSRSSPQQRAYYLIKHGLNLLQYKDLACADVSPPIVVVLPDMAVLDVEEKKYFYELGKEDALSHAERIFGRDFESFDQLLDFSKTLETFDKVESAAVDKGRVLFDTEWSGDFKSRLQRAASDEFSGLVGTNHPGVIVASQALGRMSTSNELLVKARRLRGTPIIEAPTSWQYFVWKLEYDAANAEREQHLPNLHVLRGLQSVAENEMEWLGKVPPAALIELRKSGALDEIRGLLSKGVEDLAQANPNNFFRTSDQVFDNINSAFESHRKSVAELSAKKWKFAGSDIGSWFVVGSLAVTAAATGVPVWGFAAIAADQLLDAPKLRDIPKSIRELADESMKVRKSPVGMLFKYRA